VDDLQLLRREFGAEDGSFLLQLRVDLLWDRAAFSRLEQAMRRVCASQESRQQLGHWLVEGFGISQTMFLLTPVIGTSAIRNRPSITTRPAKGSGTFSIGSSWASRFIWYPGTVVARIVGPQHS
jgi:hypothetical protein